MSLYNNLVNSFLKEEFNDAENETLSHIHLGTPSKKETFTDSNFLESIANQLFEIGNRIRLKTVTPADAEYLIEVSADVESLAKKLN